MIYCVAGRGFNNLSKVNMARHIPTGQLVAVKQTNLDECTEEELLQLMVSWIHGCGPTSLSPSTVILTDCAPNHRTRFCGPGSSVTPTCSPLAWYSAPAASCGS